MIMRTKMMPSRGDTPFQLPQRLYDLKAVDPNRKSVIDERTPGELARGMATQQKAHLDIRRSRRGVNVAFGGSIAVRRSYRGLSGRTALSPTQGVALG